MIKETYTIIFFFEEQDDGKRKVDDEKADKEEYDCPRYPWLYFYYFLKPLFGDYQKNNDINNGHVIVPPVLSVYSQFHK